MVGYVIAMGKILDKILDISPKLRLMDAKLNLYKKLKIIGKYKSFVKHFRITIKNYAKRQIPVSDSFKGRKIKNMYDAIKKDILLKGNEAEFKRLFPKFGESSSQFNKRGINLRFLRMLFYVFNSKEVEQLFWRFVYFYTKLSLAERKKVRKIIQRNFNSTDEGVKGEFGELYEKDKLTEKERSRSKKKIVLKLLPEIFSLIPNVTVQTFAGGIAFVHIFVIIIKKIDRAAKNELEEWLKSTMDEIDRRTEEVERARCSKILMMQIERDLINFSRAIPVVQLVEAKI